MSDGSLAEQLIANMEHSGGGFVPAGFHTDDLGYWVEDDIQKDESRLAQYLLFRIRKTSPSVYKIDDWMFHEHELLERGNVDQMLSLIRSPKIKITKSIAIWLYDKLYEVAPYLERRYMIVSDRYIFDTYLGIMVPIEKFNTRFITQNDLRSKEIMEKKK